MANKIKISVTGIGNRALPKDPANSNWLGWIELLRQSDVFELVAGHDPSPDACRRIVQRGYLDSADVYTDFHAMLAGTECDCLLVTSPASCHAHALRKAVRKRWHILVEKPFVTDMDAGIEIVREIKKNQLISCVSQNWRFKDIGRTAAKAVREGLIGNIGHLFFQYIRNRENPNYPEYIFEETYPLLYAMGIHHVDLFRYVLDDEIVSVSGRDFKPPWSRYRSTTGMNLHLTTKKGITIVYTGTISSQMKGFPQEFLLVEGENGSLMNRSDWSDPPLMHYPANEGTPVDITETVTARSMREQYDIADRFILDSFYRSVACGEPEICRAEDALRSVAVLEACRQALETGRVVPVSDSLA